MVIFYLIKSYSVQNYIEKAINTLGTQVILDEKLNLATNKLNSVKNRNMKPASLVIAVSDALTQAIQYVSDASPCLKKTQNQIVNDRWSPVILESDS